jgi:hypothetical protein
VYAPGLVLAFVTLVTLIFAAAQFLMQHELTARIALAVAALLTAATLFSLLRAYMRRRGTRIQVTTHGVTRVRKRFFWVTKRQIYFHSIEEVEVDQRGLGLLLNFGSLVLHLSDKEVAYHDIADPQKVADEIGGHLGHEHGQPHLVQC